MIDPVEFFFLFWKILFSATEQTFGIFLMNILCHTAIILFKGYV